MCFILSMVPTARVELATYPLRVDCSAIGATSASFIWYYIQHYNNRSSIFKALFLFFLNIYFFIKIPFIDLNIQ